MKSNKKINNKYPESIIAGNGRLSKDAIRRANKFPIGTYNEPLGIICSEMIKVLYNMVEITKDEIIGLLNKEEAMFMCDSLRGCYYDSNGSAKGYLIRGILCGEAENYGEKWDVDTDSIYNKISETTEFQAYCIICMVNEFWNEEFSNNVEKIFGFEH